MPDDAISYEPDARHTFCGIPKEEQKQHQRGRMNKDFGGLFRTEKSWNFLEIKRSLISGMLGRAFAEEEKEGTTD